MLRKLASKNAKGAERSVKKNKNKTRYNIYALCNINDQVTWGRKNFVVILGKIDARRVNKRNEEEIFYT